MLGVSRQDLKRSYQWSEQIGTDFPECNDLVQRLLVIHRQRYRRLAGLHVVWFRIIGGIEVVLSVSLPVFFVFPILSGDEANYRFLAVISVVIALSAALRNFYNWDNNWRLYRSQELVLGTLLAQWEVDLLKLTGDANTDVRRQALERTESLLRSRPR